MVASCTNPSLWIEILKVLPTAIVGAIAAYIAWRQAEIAKEQREISSAKLNLDLFERRLAVFNATWEAASNSIINDHAELAPANMTNMFPQASFLFGPEIESHMREVAAKITRLAIIRQMTIQNNNIPPSETVSERVELETWIAKAATTGIRSKFAPYLNFSDWR